MHTFTALYDKRADAEAMQAQLEQLGVIDIDHDVHDHATAGESGLWASHKGAVPPDQDRRLYEQALKHGGFLLTVNVDDAEADRVHDLLEGSNAVDIDERASELQSAGLIPAAPTPLVATQKEEMIPVFEERLQVGKRQVDRGGVRVRAYTVETPVREAVSLREERVDVERRPVGERVADGEELFQERSFEMTEMAEEAVVGKEARVVEEVLVRKDATQRVETIKDSVRHTEVEIERTGEPGPNLI